MSGPAHRRASDASGTALETDTDAIPVHDYRDAPDTAGQFQHAGQVPRIVEDVDVSALAALPAAGFTSLDSVGSVVFPVDDHDTGHGVSFAPDTRDESV